MASLGKKILLCILLSYVLFTCTSLISSVRATVQADLLTHTGYLDTLGFYHVVGEVQNTGDVHINFVKVTATFYDSNNVVIGTSFAYAMLDILLAGRKSPFDIILTDAAQSAKVHHYNLNVTFNVYPAGRPIGLEILSNSSYLDDIGWMHVVGEIKNIGNQKATYVKVIATYYNGTGNVIAVALSYSNPSDMNPDQKAPFEILLSSDRAPYVESYDLTAESMQYALIPEFPSLMCVLTGLISVVIMVMGMKKFQEL